MAIDAVSIGLSGIHAAHTRVGNSAHNVANSVTNDFRNHRTRQSEVQGGGTRASTVVDPEPREVDFASEFVEQTLAKVQAKSSARVVKTAMGLTGALLDIKV